MSSHRRIPTFVEALEARQLLAWGTFPQLIDQDLAAANFPGITGAGTTIVVLDTGIDYNHPNLGGGIGPNKKIVFGYDYVDNDTNPLDASGHGTGVASVAAGLPFTYNSRQFSGIAPGASLIALRTENGSDDFNTDAGRIHEALQWVLANRAKYNIVAVNISTGSGLFSSPVTQSPCGADFAALAAAGVLVTASSGNDGVTNPPSVEYPAADPNVYAVGSVNASGQVSTFSSRNSITDLLAPGENVTTAYYNPATKQHYYVNYASGTSFATPALAGMAALLRQINPSLTPAEQMSIIQATADYVSDPATGLLLPRLNVNNALIRASEWAGAKGPFSGTPIALGNTIEAENYDKGGDGVAYHDRSPANLGGVYRASAVDIERTGDSSGSYDVGWNLPGEWLNYTVNAATSGSYDFSIRAAYGGTLASGGTFHLESDGVDITGPLTLPKTGNWQTWATVTTKGIALSAGQHVLTLVFDKDGAGTTGGYLGNVNWIKLSLPGAPAQQSPYPGPNPFALPGQIELENFDKGGDGTAYHDLSSGNAGGQYRTADSVDIEKSAEGGYDVGWNQPGEWLEYTVNVASTGTYSLSLRGAYGGTLASGGTAHLEMDGAAVSGTITLPKTGGWQTWQTVTTTNINLTAGQHVLRLAFDTDGSGGTGGYLGNLNWMKLAPAGPGPTLPAPWTSGDVGPVGLAGTASGTGGVFTVQASGADIWGNSDAFNFVYQSLSGNGTIGARVTGVQNTDVWAKAGIMIRESLAANSRNSYLAVSAGGTAAFQGRFTTGGNSTGVAVGSVAGPFWLKLTRSGNTLTAYTAPDGGAWTNVGTQTISGLATNVLIGLAVTGHNNTTLNTSTFDNVAVS